MYKMYHVDNEIQTEHFILTDVDKLKIKKRLLILIFFLNYILELV